MKLGDVWPEPLNDPVVIDTGGDVVAAAKPASAVITTAPMAPPIPSVPSPNEGVTKPFVRPSPVKAGEPDAGVMGVHTVVQGMITYQPKDIQYALAPWQVMPFSEGFEFVAKGLNVLFHRGVYQVGNNGAPLPEGPVSPASFARNSWNYYTPADSICGFSGLHFTRFKVMLDRLTDLQFMSSDIDSRSPWSAEAFVRGKDMTSVLPKFWVELDETPGRFNPAAPFARMWDISTGKSVKVVPLEHWHFLAPIPGIPRLTNLAGVDVLGRRFLLNRIYLGGTGWIPGREAGNKCGEPMLFEDLLNPFNNQKLDSVILPCLRSTGKSGSSDGVQNEVFSKPSAPALSRLRGDPGSPLRSCF